MNVPLYRPGDADRNAVVVANYREREQWPRFPGGRLLRDVTAFERLTTSNAEQSVRARAGQAMTVGTEIEVDGNGIAWPVPGRRVGLTKGSVAERVSGSPRTTGASDDR